jgi:hypothetical protein
MQRDIVNLHGEVPYLMVCRRRKNGRFGLAVKQLAS